MSTSAQNQEIFVGLQNYVTLFTDEDFAPRFWGALKNNFVFFLRPHAGAKLDRLAAGGLLTSGSWGSRFYRTMLFMPTVLSVVIIGFIWQLILNPLWGVAESMLKVIGLGRSVQALAGLTADGTADGRR